MVLAESCLAGSRNLDPPVSLGRHQLFRGWHWGYLGLAVWQTRAQVTALPPTERVLEQVIFCIWKLGDSTMSGCCLVYKNFWWSREGMLGTHGRY